MLLIASPNPLILVAARQRQMQLTKPAGSLGKLEEIACRLAACRNLLRPAPLRPAVTVFAADHGVAHAGVSAYPRAVTAAMMANFVGGGAAIAVLARAIQAPLELVDVGVDADLSALAIIHAKVAAGSRDLRIEDALTAADLVQAKEVGRAAARRAKEAGATLLIGGEMGIGNSTAAAALTAKLLGLDAATATGRGTGVDDAGWERKRQAVTQALIRCQHHQRDEALAALGGLEIAALSGFYLEGARLGLPILLDGFITTSAALAACEEDPAVRPWLFASHCSAEKAHLLALHALGLEPVLDLGLRLGEASGAALAFPVLDLALRLLAEMATFADAGVPGGDR